MSKNDILNESLNKAFKGGVYGSVAMSSQVMSLMWLRTTMNFQYNNGGTTLNTIKYFITL